MLSKYWVGLFYLWEARLRQAPQLLAFFSPLSGFKNIFFFCWASELIIVSWFI